MQKQVSFRLDNNLFDKLKELSNETNRSQSFYIQEAIKNLIDDYQDYKDAINSINNNKGEKTYSLDELALLYGLDK
ncbi:type II toxin-antitoxin system RelB family antitoxin [Campylobacter sputorum]|uniref:type II toxin-antitoxin system RelB family antitoxin n=1 Tax=Campylobacter sputorum TaxID=206 RepID=UPI00053BEDAA|nr:ribbon-helix-helix domain-containing protein [Campylobacter sputorum]